MSNETIKAFVTKYALTDGIKVVDGELFANNNAISYGNVGYGPQYAHGNEWHATPEAAIDRAEEMRKKKIASLRKQIEKLEAMKFEING